jgi:hypothetical protein
MGDSEGVCDRGAMVEGGIYINEGAFVRRGEVGEVVVEMVVDDGAMDVMSAEGNKYIEGELVVANSVKVGDSVLSWVGTVVGIYKNGSEGQDPIG